MAHTQGRFRWLRAAPALGLFVVSVAFGQTSTPPATVDDALHQMSDRAGVIFAGQVIEVRKQRDDGDATGFVAVEFHVDQAIRGCMAGTTYTLREWAGLWAGGAQRYRVGERLLMFLHTPGASGLSSPVDGMDGAIPIHGSAASTVASGVATGSSVQYPVADLRWIGAELLRPVSYRAESVHSDHRNGLSAGLSVPFVEPQRMVRARAGGAENARIPVRAAALTIGDSDAPSGLIQQEPVQAVIVKLRNWQSQQKARDAAR